MRLMRLSLPIPPIPVPTHLVCLVVGHDPSWVHAVSVGVMDRPVCRVCGQVRPRDSLSA